MKEGNIGILETFVLSSIAYQKDQAYGVSIKNDLEDRLGRRYTYGTISSTTDRLEGKKFIESRLVLDQERGPGDRTRRCFQLTPQGLSTLENLLGDFKKLEQGINCHLN